MDIKIRIEAPELAESIALLASAIAYKEGQAVDPKVPAKIEVSEETKTEQNVPEEAPKETKPQQPVVTIEDLRAAFMGKNSKINTPKLKKILSDHKVKKVTDLEEKDFESVLKALEAV